MTALLCVLAMGGASLGWGLAVLWAARVKTILTSLEYAAWALVIGMGTLGWVAFPVNLLMGANLWASGTVVSAGLAFLALRRSDLAGAGHPTTAAGKAHPLLMASLLLLVAVVAILDFASALVPPADADSVAYHFGFPKEMLMAGEVVFAPRAVESAIPLLLHMTYLTALALKGEMAVTGWCWLSAWFLPLAVFASSRRYLELPWALALMIAVKTLPAVVYGSSSGQIEVRLTALFFVAAFATTHARRQATLGPAVLAGIAAGFCAAAKYSGLLAPAVCGLALLGATRRDLARMSAFSVAAIIAGGQWYLWNWLHTGDPLFPVLWGVVPYTPAAHWDDGMATAVQTSMTGELGVPKSLYWLLVYPIKATFDGVPVFESARTGFGPLPILLLPFALASVWRHRASLRGHELFLVGFICLTGYVLWFLGGSSQRVRHFLPEIIPLLMALTVAAVAATRTWPSLAKPLAVGITATIGIQMGGLLVYSAGNLRHLLSGAGREAYLTHNIAAYPLAQWLNAHLKPQDKVMLTVRELVFHLDIPVQYSPPNNDGRIHQAPPQPSPTAYLKQLRAQGVTHVVQSNIPAGQQMLVHRPRSEMESLNLSLIEAGCATILAKVRTPPLLQSRTLRLVNDQEDVVHYVLLLTQTDCRLQP